MKFIKLMLVLSLVIFLFFFSSLVKNVFFPNTLKSAVGILESSKCDTRYRGDVLWIELNDAGIKKRFHTIGLSCGNFRKFEKNHGKQVVLKFKPSTKVIKYLDIDGSVLISESGSSVRAVVGLIVLSFVFFIISLVLWRYIKKVNAYQNQKRANT